MRKFSEIKERLLEFAKIKRIKKMEFYEIIGIDSSNFAGKMAESELSADKIARILVIFPELNPDWLLLGKGEMLRKEDAKQVAMATAPQSNASNGNLNIGVSSELVELISSQQETINRLSQTIDKLINK